MNNMVPIHVHVPTQLLATIERLASKANISRAEFIRRAIAEYLISPTQARSHD